MKIAVTAASGHLGASIVKQLLLIHEQKNIIAVAKTPEKAENLGVEVRKGDYNDRDQFDEVLRGIDTVLLVSGMDAPDKRIKQHRNVIDAAIQAGVKKLVYTSIFGQDKGFGFSPIVASNRQTEEDIRASGLEWAVGRNGLYIEPDVDYIENYKKAGKIANCAGGGRCAYTTRDELGYVYARMILEDKHNGHTYTLAGEPITQQQLADFINLAFGTRLVYETMTVEEYRAKRSAALGDFFGGIIAGIYESVLHGAMDIPSDYGQAAGRDHISWKEYFKGLKRQIR